MALFKNSSNRFAELERWFIWGIAALSFVLGIWGYSEYYRCSSQSAGVIELAYLSLDLFLLDFAPLSDVKQLPLPLEVARWLAPAVIAYSAIKAIINLYGERWLAHRLQRWQGHAVVFGLSATSLKVAVSLKSVHQQVVIVSKDQQSALIDAAKSEGIAIKIGSFASEQVWQSVNVMAAKAVYLASGDDSLNINIASYLYQQVPEYENRQQKCVLEVDDMPTVLAIADTHLIEIDKPQISVTPFNSAQYAARNLLTQHGPDVYNLPMLLTHQKNTLVFFGDASFIKIAVYQFAKLGHYGLGSQLRIVVACDDAEVVTKQIAEAYPQISKILNLEPITYSLAENDKFVKEISTNALVTYGFGCSISEACALMAIQLKGASAPMVFCRFNEEIRDDFLRLQCKSHNEHKVFYADLLAGSTDFNDLAKLTIDGTAIKIHENYCKSEYDKAYRATDAEEKANILANPNLTPWASLREEVKESNRGQADHQIIKARLLLERTEFTHDDLEALLTQENTAAIEHLSIVEHDRWCAEKRLAGWEYCEDGKNALKKQHHCLRPWSELSEGDQYKDVDAVRNLVDLLK